MGRWGDLPDRQRQRVLPLHHQGPAIYAELRNLEARGALHLAKEFALLLWLGWSHWGVVWMELSMPGLALGPGSQV